MHFASRFSVTSSTLYMRLGLALLFLLLLASFAAAQSVDSAKHETVTGKAAFSDYSQQKPGTFRKIALADLPAPFATESVDNGPDLIPRPANAWPQTVPGFKVELYASGLANPRFVRTAHNGDLVLAEVRSGEIKILRGVTKEGKAQQTELFA